MILFYSYTYILGMQKAFVVRAIQNGYKMEKPEYCPGEIYEKMEQCWDLDRNKRPTFQSLYCYFSGFQISTDDEWAFNDSYQRQSYDVMT